MSLKASDDRISYFVFLETDSLLIKNVAGKAPLTRLVASLPCPLMMHLIVPPLLTKAEYSGDILHGKCPTVLLSS